MKKTLTMFAATAAMAFASITSINAQTNLGEDCGCPPTGSRPNEFLSTYATNGGTDDGVLLTSMTLGCDKTWILDKKIYVDSLKTLTILPGAVVKGRTYSTADSATALIVSRGGKLIAEGTQTCPIVFTAELDNMSGTYGFENKGKWGGIVICGTATNNLTLAANGPHIAGTAGKLAIANGLGVVEGFASNNPKFYFGADLTAGEVFNDNDNSGVLKHIQIRHSGANLQVGAEINGLTLCSVGKGTIIEHVDIVSCADDGIEFFGGNVNVKYISMLFGNDDNFDWDLGWSGKAQFLFVLKTDTMASKDADNGIEADGDDDKSNLLPRSHPQIYNATFIGNVKNVRTSDNSALAAINAKEITEGEIYNSIFAKWDIGYNMTKALGTRTGGSEAYHNWSVANGNGSQSLKVKCNTFVGVTKPLTIDRAASGATFSADTAQFYTTDKNVAVATLPGFNFTATFNNTANTVLPSVDPVPSPAISTAGCPSVPNDGFFTAVPYRGAFSSINSSWLSEWSYAAVRSIVAGVKSCPTDINEDGSTNNSDFLELLGKFNQNCQ